MKNIFQTRLKKKKNCIKTEKNEQNHSGPSSLLVKGIGAEDIAEGSAKSPVSVIDQSVYSLSSNSGPASLWQGGSTRHNFS